MRTALQARSTMTTTQVKPRNGQQQQRPSMRGSIRGDAATARAASGRGSGDGDDADAASTSGRRAEDLDLLLMSSSTRPSRRSVLLSGTSWLAATAAAAAAATTWGACDPRPARAAIGTDSLLSGSDEGDSLSLQLPGEPPAAPELPRAYRQTVSQLSKALREAIEAEAGGAKEAEVRRKADPAKDLAKRFLRRWQDDPSVMGDPSHSEMTAALKELGAFYQANGPRARLGGDAAAGVLARLDRVDASLPPEEKGLLGL